MTRGVIFYNINTKCLIRLCVAMSGLRNHYDGPATLLYDGDLPDFVKEIAKTYNVDMQQLPTALDRSDGNALVRKSMLWRFTPYEVSLFMDSDTLVMGDLSPMFDLIEKHGLVFTQFSDWGTDSGRMKKRISAWEPVIGKTEVQKALAHGRAVNTGVFGFRIKDSTLPFLKEWENLSMRGWRAKCTRRIVDEVAAQVLLHKYAHHMTDDRWNSSVRFATNAQPVIYHYHGSKHVGEWDICQFWKVQWVLLYAHFSDDTMHQLTIPHGDKRFGRWVDETEALKPKIPDETDITIVTAVNPKYDEKLRKNLPLWLEQDFFKNKQIVVFVNGYKNAKERAWLNEYKNVTVIKWNHPPAGDNIRHRMLAAFVFGVANHIGTKYWMKLDADCTPKEPFVLPENWQQYSVISHKWGYTKMKGDPSTEKHWLNRLDDWMSDMEPLFPDNITTKTYRHKRYASFCHIEETQMTREMAETCGDDLPIPSQDTLSWYYATQRDLPILYTNMKRFFSP